MKDSAHVMLKALARYYGIQLSFYDISGVNRTASDSLLRELLLQIGAGTQSELCTHEGCKKILARERVRRWNRITEPLCVVEEGTATFKLSVTLANPLCGRPLQQRLWDEAGILVQGGDVPRAQSRYLRTKDIEGQRFERQQITVDAPRAPGYYDLELIVDETIIATVMIVIAPKRCYLPDAFERGERGWILAAQLYSLRSHRNWGIGDFTDLLALVEEAHRVGAAGVGLNPLHATRIHVPQDYSPYFPTSRSLYNPLYLDIERIEEFVQSTEAQELVRSTGFQCRLQQLRGNEHLDYAAVSALKWEVFELLYRHFQEHQLRERTPRALEFKRYIDENQAVLEPYTVFECLERRAQKEFEGRPWMEWPRELQSYHKESIEQLKPEERTRVGLYQYVQWQTAVQLRAVQERCAGLGMPVGLYVDLALGSNRAGIDSWLNQSELLVKASMGAPPDAFSPTGQEWGLPPYAPRAFRERRYKPFIDAIRANMRYAGAMRIDHVMSLLRVYCVPQFAEDPANLETAGVLEGAYLRYLLPELMGILALESERCRTVLIGEDLGTVPPRIREEMNRRGMLSYQVVIFNRNTDGKFLEPKEYPYQALSTFSTHDLPTALGYWRARDIELREGLGLFADPSSAETVRQNREVERRALREALQIGDSDSPEELIVGISRFLAQTNSWLTVLAIDDLQFSEAQINLPGSTQGYPSWRNRLPLESIGLQDFARRVGEVMQGGGRNWNRKLER